MLRFVRENDLERVERLKKNITAYVEGKADEVTISDEDLLFMLNKTIEQVYDEQSEQEEDEVEADIFSTQSPFFQEGGSNIQKNV